MKADKEIKKSDFWDSFYLAAKIGLVFVIAAFFVYLFVWTQKIGTSTLKLEKSTQATVDNANQTLVRIFTNITSGFSIKAVARNVTAHDRHNTTSLENQTCYQPDNTILEQPQWSNYCLKKSDYSSSNSVYNASANVGYVSFNLTANFNNTKK